MKLFLVVVSGQTKQLIYNESAKSFKDAQQQYSTPLYGGQFRETTDRVYFFGNSPYGGKVGKEEFTELSKGLEAHFKGKEIIISHADTFEEAIDEQFEIDLKKLRKRFPKHTRTLKLK